MADGVTGKPPAKRPRPRIVALLNGAVHVSSCPHALGRNVVPLEVEDSGELARQITFEGLRTSKCCKPVDRLARWEKWDR